MVTRIHYLIVATAVTILILLVILLVQKCRCFKKIQQHKAIVANPGGRAISLSNGIPRLHDQERYRDRTSYYGFLRMVSLKHFSWDDNPALVNDAFENGWSRFAFTNHACYIASPSVRSARTLFGACAAGDHVNDRGVEISWEVCEDSTEFMQKIRLNSDLKKLNSNNSVESVIKTALPLPGPVLGNSAFPREAYFEITILDCSENDDQGLVGHIDGMKSEGEKTQLILDKLVDQGSESSVQVTSEKTSGNDMKDDFKEDAKNEVVALSLGLCGGGSLPLKLPGSYSGSIGFNSNGSVYLDGTKLIVESKMEEWGRKNKVVGCGYNPSQKMVFFTVDSKLVHEINCETEEFGSPLFPTLAANSDSTVVVNLGQSVFKYAPANLQRTPNPCFTEPLTNSPALGYEDSKELFSMERIDSQWLNGSATLGHSKNGHSTDRGSDVDHVSEGDLFEIVLESYARSPHRKE